MPTNNPTDRAAQDHAPEQFFSETLMAVLRLLPTLPRDEREELLHHVKCSLAEFNRMYARAYFADDYNDMEGAFAALHASGFEPTINCVLDEDEVLEATTCVDINGVSTIRDSEFLGWLSELLKPFGGYVEEAGYADPLEPGTSRPTDH